MSDNGSRFDKWYGSPAVQQKVGAAYSLGASVVIIGAMFKILHLTGAGTMLGIGMSCEAFLFALGIFDKPHKNYEWENVFDFENKTPIQAGGIQSQVSSTEATTISTTKSVAAPSRAVGLNYSETIDDEDVKKLSEGIKNLTATAQQFAGLSDVVGATDQFVKNIDSATQITGKFISSQESLNSATGLLDKSYQGISDGMESVEKSTKIYAGKVEDINKNLSSINSIYEIQLKNIQAQSEGLTQQTERIHTVAGELNVIADDVKKMKSATAVAAEETENFKISTTKLAKQVADLNQVYGNMLNALSN